MPSLDQHTSSQFVKVLYIGSSGSGKTASLVSLLPDYDLRIIDLDNGLDALVNHGRELHPERLGSVQYETRRDKYRASAAGPIIQGAPKTFIEVHKLLDLWTDGTKPEEWGPSKVLVIDSLTNLGLAAFEWAKAMNPSYKDPRLWVGAAQGAIEQLIMVLTSETFRTNVIVISHIDFQDEISGRKGYASSIGRALGPKLPRNFNTLLLAESKTLGKNVQRTIKTAPTPEIDLKNPAPMRIVAEYPLATGMAEIFTKLKGK